MLRPDARVELLNGQIVDMSPIGPSETIEVHRKSHFTGYGSCKVLRAGDQANPASFPDVTVDVAELLKR